MSTKSLTVIASQPEPPEVNIDRFARECARLAGSAARLVGPGANAVRAAAQQLLTAIEIFEQHRRRLAAEVLRAGAE